MNLHKYGQLIFDKAWKPFNGPQSMKFLRKKHRRKSLSIRGEKVFRHDVKSMIRDKRKTWIS